MPDTNLAPSFICLLALMITMFGCTSVQWRDGNGIEHHLGLMAYEVNCLEYGTQLKRISLGIDIRLSGPDRGVSIGAKRITGLVPQMKMVERPEELLDEVLDFYRHTPTSRHQTQTVRSGILYLTEELSSEITMIDTDSLGFDWRMGPASPGLNLGYGGSHQLVGRATDDGIVQIHLKAGNDKNAQAIKLWAL
ncbi:MAG: hypothetical protein ABL983_24595, partial [Nitrospira sp.]